MSSFFNISQETEAILKTIGFSLHPTSIEQLWELISWWCASGNFPVLTHFVEMIFGKLFQDCHNRICTFHKQLFHKWMQMDLQDQLNVQQSLDNIQQPQHNIQQSQQNIQQLQQNILQNILICEQNIENSMRNIRLLIQNLQQPQHNILHNQQLGQAFQHPGGNGMPQQIQQRFRLSQWWWQKFQEVWQNALQQGRASQQHQKDILLYIQTEQMQTTMRQLEHRLQPLEHRLQQERRQLEGELLVETGKKWKRLQQQRYLHLPQQTHSPQGESPQHIEELLILACQVLTALPENETLMGDLVDGIMYADVAGVSIEKAASYLSTEHLNHVITALTTERKKGDFTLAAETLRKLARDRSLQDLSVVSILQAAKGDARRVWSLTELPEPLKEMFHIPFQELYKELKQ